MKWAFAIGVLSAFLACTSCSDVDWKAPRPVSAWRAVAGVGEVTLEWEPSPAATGYHIYLAAESGIVPADIESLAEGRQVDAAGTSWSVTGLIPDQTYYFVVVSHNVGGESVASQELSAQPLGTGHFAPEPSVEPIWLQTGPAATANFGSRVDSAGDTNADGFEDVIISAPGYVSNDVHALVYLGSSELPSTEAVWTQEGNQDALGVKGFGVGDLNADGYDDIAVGAPGFDGAAQDQGTLELFNGSANGPELTASFTVEGSQAGAELGASAAAADVNGDGFTDLIVGSPGFDGAAGSNTGRALLWLGRTTDLPAAYDWEFEGTATTAALGATVAGAGDVNGDGYDEVIVTAPLHDDAYLDEGAVYLFEGSAQGLSTSPVWSRLGGGDDLRLGSGGAGAAGDVNGDGFADVYVTVPRASGEAGRVDVFYGSANGLPAQASWSVTSEQALARCGSSVAGADVNQDGYSDLIVGAELYDGGGLDSGRVYFFAGSAGGLDTTGTWFADGVEAGERHGASVATVDFNGDGSLDVLVGSPLHDAGLNDRGRASVYYGPARTGPRVLQSSVREAQAGVPFQLVGAGFEDSAPGPAGRQCRVKWGDGTPDDVIDDCAPSDLENTTHTYAQPASFTVRIRVDNASGLWGEAVFAIKAR